MKKALLVLVALITMAQAEIFVDKQYTCTAPSITVHMEIMDGGMIARLGSIMFFNIKSGLYAGVGNDGKKLYFITYPKKDEIEIGGEEMERFILPCVEATSI